KEPDPFAITFNDEPNRMIGALGVHWASQPNGTMEMGYAIGEPYWGRGLVVEAAAEVMRFVFTEYAVERLQARGFVGNDSSERVLQKLGSTGEGVLRSLISRRGAWHDLVIYSLLREEWEGGATSPPTPGRPG